MIQRYEPYLADTSGDPTHGDMEQARMREADDGEWVRFDEIETEADVAQSDWAIREQTLVAALRGVLDVAEGRSKTTEAIMVIDRVRQALAQSETICEHDLQKPNCTVEVAQLAKVQRGECRICHEVWINPPYGALAFASDRGAAK